MTVRSITAAVALGASLVAAPVQSAVLLQDSFDADNGATVLNFNSLINWTVGGGTGGGTIDYIRSGGFGISCFGGAGGCLDMDGSTGNAGRITSSAVFVFDAGIEYSLSGMVSGNQRGGSNDSIIFGFVNTVTLAETVATLPDIPFGAPFSQLTVVASGLSGTYRVFIEGVGGDNVGVILDNVQLSDNRTPGVPEPATLLLSGLALLAAGATRRHGRR